MLSDDLNPPADLLWIDSWLACMWISMYGTSTFSRRIGLCFSAGYLEGLVDVEAGSLVSYR